MNANPTHYPDPTRVEPVNRHTLAVVVDNEPGVLARVAGVLGDHGISVKSVVQKGDGDEARLVMVVHPVLESRFFAALDALRGVDLLRTAPRAIRVIEEEFA